MLVGQISGVRRPHIVRGGVDVHWHEGEEADIRLLQAGPLVPGPAEFADLRADIRAECGQQGGRHPQPTDKEHECELPEPIRAAGDPTAQGGEAGRNGGVTLGDIGVGDDGLGLRWFESLIAVLLPGPAESPADRPWQHALSCRKAHHNHDEPKVDGKRQHKEYGIGPIPIGDGAVFKIPVQRSHRCA